MQLAITGSLMVSLLLCSPASPQSQAGPPQSVTQRQHAEVLKELRAIREAIERLAPAVVQTPARPRVVRLTNLKGFALGQANAPLTLIEFTDLQCQFCRQFALTVFDEIKKNWIDTGKLRYITRDLPLDFHPQAMRAARASRCAGEQGKFWELRLALVRNAHLLTPEYISKAAADLRLDPIAFSRCIESSAHDADIQADMTEAASLGVRGTPTFLVGRADPTGFEGSVLQGALPYTQFDSRFNALLQAIGRQPN